MTIGIERTARHALKPASNARAAVLCSVFFASFVVHFVPSIRVLRGHGEKLLDALNGSLQILNRIVPVSRKTAPNRLCE